VSQIQEIKERLDIVEFIGERITLQRSGKNFRACCPFHSEKTPSFFVSPEMQSFICFGCHKKGDIFTFVQEYDRLSFPETLELLAGKAGIELKQEFSDPLEKQRRTILEILDLAGQYYAYLLTQHAKGEAGREYLKKRQASSSTVKQFGIGYAPDGWDHLFTYLTRKKKFSKDDVLASGLVIQGQNGKIYDRFRKRLVFPLHDHRGRVVGFSGRLLEADAKEAKYVNTPETAVYHKRYLLYGYSQNLEAIREKTSVIIVEGEFDVLSSVQAHVKNIVAVKGSALTVEQIRILARTAKTLYLALDADSAGVAATIRAIELVQPFPISLRIIPLTGGKDPDELAKNDPTFWRETIEKHISAFEYVMEAMIRQHDIKTAEGQKAVTDNLLRLLLSVEHAVERSFYLRQLAERMDVSEGILEEQWTTLQQQRAKKQALPAQKQTEEEKPAAPEADDPQERYFTQLLLNTEQPPEQLLQNLTPELFSDAGLARLIGAYKEWWSNHDTFLLKSFSARLPAELQGLTTDLYLEQLLLTADQFPAELRSAFARLRERSLKNEKESLALTHQKLSDEQQELDETDSRYKELDAKRIELETKMKQLDTQLRANITF
jgi:DNA primase